METEHLMQMKS
jgi:ESCRT-II complex subunit VPS22